MPAYRPTPEDLVRRFTLGSGPMKRGSDHVEFLSRLLLVSGISTTAPVGLAVAAVTRARARARATAQAADRHVVAGLLLADPHVPARGAPRPARRPATAVWTGPGGVEHRGPVWVPAGSTAGAAVAVWLDGAGNRALPPLSPGEVTGRAVGRGLGTSTALAVAAVGAHLAVRALLDRSRSRRWAAEWAAVEPVWTGTGP
ncbi:membrane protein [Geodermatophilus aquaeductus]|uniref:Uncharacterized protein n=1 Tax=Geodermatophilus aquaeductus TaxID=1564161 RepID=A0A521E148_9ACTN|nr:hypothetical protein [Geodermatophilus aquaeductus]SMO77555.1 hypothetical protein SAMN06273567_10485 [Geodermatophilus aquaeductus]